MKMTVRKVKNIQKNEVTVAKNQSKRSQENRNTPRNIAKEVKVSTASLENTKVARNHPISATKMNKRVTDVFAVIVKITWRKIVIELKKKVSEKEKEAKVKRVQLVLKGKEVEHYQSIRSAQKKEKGRLGTENVEEDHTIDPNTQVLAVKIGKGNDRTSTTMREEGTDLIKI